MLLGVGGRPFAGGGYAAAVALPPVLLGGMGADDDMGEARGDEL